MAIESPPVYSPDGLKDAALVQPPVTASFEERWAAWRSRGAAHDREVRRRMAMAAPVLVAVAAILYIVFVG
jgi:hypothetical protein